jgi:mycothiol synthase
MQRKGEAVTVRLGDEITLANIPDVPGLRFRHFRGEVDFPAMTEVLNASWQADGIDQVYTAERFAAAYTASPIFDPARQIILGEVDGTLIAFARMYINEKEGKERVHMHFGYVRPEWRRRGIGRAMLHYIHQSMALALTPPEHNKLLFFESRAGQTQTGMISFLQNEGYQPHAYFANMVRPKLEDIPDLPLPPGIEVRPVQPEHLRVIFDAQAEAFQDDRSAGFTLEQFMEEVKHTDPALWRVAWEGDQVVGMVRSFIRQEENQSLGRTRGYTEYISVRKPWRGKGIAKALITRSLEALKAEGMTEAALMVNTQNATGAFQLYEGLGYQIVDRSTIYRKSIPQ